MENVHTLKNKKLCAFVYNDVAMSYRSEYSPKCNILKII